MFFKRYGNITLGIFFMAASIVYYCMADALPISTLTKIGPDFMPKIVAGLTFAISATLTCLGIQTLRRTPKPRPEPSQEEYGRVLLTVLVFTCYAMLFESIGFIVTTFVYLTLQILILAPEGKRNVPLSLAVSLATTLAVFFIFRDALSVMLPAGVLRNIV